MTDADNTSPSALSPAELDQCGGGQRTPVTPIKAFQCPSDPRALDAAALRLAGGGALPRTDPEWKYVPVRR